MAPIVNTLLSIQTSVKCMHWMSKTYVEHEALGRLYSEMDSHIDRLVESVLGMKGQRDMAQVKSIPFTNWWSPKKSSGAILSEMHDALIAMRGNLPDESTQSISDDIINAVRVAMYLVGMK
jgi:hypothetical protein